MVESGLRPIVLQARADREKPVYTTELRYISRRGLSEVTAAAFEVGTKAFEQVKDFLDNTSSGSIGLAGPRGTGKSTVIESFVAGRTTRRDGRLGQAIRVSAPVDYVPREFILHLFARLCLSVFLPEFAPGAYDPTIAQRLVSRTRLYRSYIALAISVLLAASGSLLLAVSSGRVHVNVPLWVGAGLLFLSIIAAYIAFLSPDRPRRADRDRMAAEERAAEGVKLREVSDEVAGIARRDLSMIRFQQTYTSGWSGTLTVAAGPISGQAGLTGGTSFQDNVLSLPDIVARFRELVEAVSKSGPVIIGIDELDKIQSPERAQAFLDDIKSVFGVDHCYYLVSISEDALANFERRGLPIRDAFDSALDDVVHLAPLGYQPSLELIRGRVVGLPEPYVALAYCLSGGLPRDMIRWTRASVLAGEETIKLSAVCELVIGDDIRRKLEATIVALTDDHAADSEAETAMRYLSTLQPVASVTWLLSICEANLRQPSRATALPQRLSAIMKGMLNPAANSAQGDGTEASRGQISGRRGNGFGSNGNAASPTHRMLVNLFGYYYFCATILEIFTDSLAEESFDDLARDEPAGTLRQLAGARQMFATDSWLAITEISSFRRERLLIGLLESGKILHRKVGRHRRITYEALMEYKRHDDLERRAAADDLADLSQELGLY